MNVWDPGMLGGGWAFINYKAVFSIFVLCNESALCTRSIQLYIDTRCCLHSP